MLAKLRCRPLSPVGGHQDLPTGGQQGVPASGQLVTQRSQSSDGSQTYRRSVPHDMRTPLTGGGRLNDVCAREPAVSVAARV